MEGEVLSGNLENYRRGLAGSRILGESPMAVRRDYGSFAVAAARQLKPWVEKLVLT